jgi:hypothetical protein
MDKPKEAAKAAGTVTVGDAKIKMIQNPAGFIEPDMAAAQAETDENRFAGPNPYPPGTARAQAWEHLKNSQK